ncbi:E3 ubiquitin-protein ligase NHLRC1-like [Microcaecilia unicolor]|uniref:RING-type E3 ubiquitin transferase n=1 Tax=Microcaecilia unicolor TaxID=1415580 RepID=A0A6P7YRA7_9AMPH|nr:E3 ubiquitin-protein ligase NHLRC1-like [Microcaecilia unicolor]
MSATTSKQIRAMQDLLHVAEVNLLECKVCFEKYSQQQPRRPRNLTCGHVLCSACVSSLARPALECPFCRRACSPSETSDCLPLLHLKDILSRVANDPVSSDASEAEGPVTRLSPAGFILNFSFGGWGLLVSPTGMTVCQKLGCIAVVQDGKKRIKLFSMTGACIQQLGEKRDSSNSVRYPLDVAITSDGYLVVTDAGDRSVKVFDFKGRCKLVVRGTFCLPWGVDVNPQNEILVTDTEAGALWLLQADLRKEQVKKSQRLHSSLCQPRGVAVCPATGTLAVIEHLNTQGTRVKLFSSDMTLIGQVDSSACSLLLPSEIHMTGVAFGRGGNILVTDVQNGAVLSLGTARDFPSVRSLVTRGLCYPTAVNWLENESLVVLDSGDHSVKIFAGC